MLKSEVNAKNKITAIGALSERKITEGKHQMIKKDAEIRGEC